MLTSECEHKIRNLEERMEVLDQVMRRGKVPLMLVACRTLMRREIEQRQQPLVRYMMSAEGSSQSS